MKASELMSTEVACITINDTTNNAARLMWECDCGLVPVVESSESRRLAGVITDRDICMAAYTQGKALSEIPVRSAMSEEVATCGPDDPLTSVERLMRESQVRRVPVVDSSDCLVGIISLADIARRAGDEKAGADQHIGPRRVSEALAGISRPHEATART